MSNLCGKFTFAKGKFNQNQEVSTFNPTKRQQNRSWFQSNKNLIILLQYIPENVWWFLSCSEWPDTVK